MGFAINALDDKEVIRTINSITAESYEQFRTSLKAIDKKESVNDNAEFFRQLKKELGQ
jgi:hypothetical protein